MQNNPIFVLINFTISISVPIQIHGTILEKIVVQCPANSKQHIGANPRLPKYLIQVFTGTVHLPGQPGDGPPLPSQFLLNDQSKMKSLVIHHTY